MAECDIVHVAIAPPDTLEASLVKEVAAILNKDLYGTRLLLAGKIPRICAHYQTVQAAESVANSLRALGLVPIVCSDSELCRRSSASFRAHNLRLGRKEVIFRDKGGKDRSIREEILFLIISGTMRTHVDKETTMTRMKFNLPATVMTGGIPIWRRIKQKTTGVFIKTEGFLRLYDQNSLEPIVEIPQNDFDYSFLGTKMAASSITNLRSMAKELSGRFPEAVFDDRLAESFGVDVPFALQRDEIDMNCKLIYLNHKAMIGPHPYSGGGNYDC